MKRILASLLSYYCAAAVIGGRDGDGGSEVPCQRSPPSIQPSGARPDIRPASVVSLVGRPISGVSGTERSVLPPMRTLIAILAAALLLGTTASAQAADTAFSSRYAETLRGDVLAIGNTSMSCPTGAANCDAARNRTTPLSNN